jgi:hypothetical protein
MPLGSRLVWIAAALTLTSAVGCGGAHDAQDAPSSDAVEVIASPVQPDFRRPLSESSCFVASLEYELQLLGNSPRGASLCADIATAYLSGKERLPWPPPNPLDADLVNECVFERGSDIMAVARSGSDAAIAHSTRICDGLSSSGWTRPLDDAPGESDDGTASDTPRCVVADTALEVELVGISAGGRSLCEDLGRLYLDGNGRDWPAVREGTLSESSCSAERGEETVNVLAVEEQGVERAATICRALAGDGWRLVAADGLGIQVTRER